MKKLLFVLSAFLSLNSVYAQTGLIINEFSQGTGGTKEFFEFVVIGQRTCVDSTADLRGWIFDDHNDWYSGAGAAPGCYRLSMSNNWANVPIGSIIVVYNATDKNVKITQADDPTDANNDRVYILPHNSSYIEALSSEPSSSSGPNYSYPSTGWGSSSGGWKAGLNNGGDAVISVDPASPGQAFHSIIYSNLSAGGTNTPTIVMPNVGSGDNCYLTNGSYTSSSAYSRGSAGTSNETPGAANNTANASWINSLIAPSGGGAASRDTINRSICLGSSYDFNGNTYSTAGYYTATFPHSSGCDSVVVLNLNVINGILVSTVKTDVTCNGGSNGTATAIASGGIQPYKYSWNSTPPQIKNPVTNLQAGTYIVTVTDNIGCEGKDTIIIDEPQQMSLTVSEDRQTCPNMNDGEASVSVSGGVAPLNITWTTSPIQNGPTAYNLEEGVYTVTVTDANGCSESGTVSITPFPVKNIIVSADSSSICVGGSVQLNASQMNTYTWLSATGLSCTSCPDPIAQIFNTTTYTVIGEDINGCKDTGNVTVNLLDRTPTSIDPDVTICAGATVQLNATGGIEYSWTPEYSISNKNIANPVVQPDTTTTYRVIVTENKCYKDTLFQTVIVHPIPTVDAGPDIKGIPGAEIQLHANVTGAGNIEWSPSNNLSCVLCPNPVLRLQSTTTYRVTVSNAGGCEAHDLIIVSATCEGTEIFMPNTFTPNGDGQNDYFYPQGSGIGTVKRFKVMNSWGQLMYQAMNVPANNPSSGWDGTFNGQKLAPDVFIYMVELGCGSEESKIITGDITLMR